jgi:hypothetical protein
MAHSRDLCTALHGRCAKWAVICTLWDLTETGACSKYQSISEFPLRLLTSSVQALCCDRLYVTCKHLPLYTAW